jgi:hypothetical protein
MVFIYHIFFVHLSVDGHLGWFHSLALVNSAAINMGVQVSLCVCWLTFLWGYAKSRVAWQDQKGN